MLFWELHVSTLIVVENYQWNLSLIFSPLFFHPSVCLLSSQALWHSGSPFQPEGSGVGPPVGRLDGAWDIKWPELRLKYLPKNPFPHQEGHTLSLL